LENKVQGNYRTIPQFAWFDLGVNNWSELIQEVVEVDTFEHYNIGDTLNVYYDNDVVNGITYRYYVAAYDSGNGITGPLENGNSNVPNAGNNTVEIVPQTVVAAQTVANVRAVPNPYKIAEIWEGGWSEHKIQFTNMPARAVIKVFNSAGELIKTIYHESGVSIAPSIAEWDLRNEFNQLVAPGVYFYHVSSDLGSTTGKVFVIL